MSEEEKRTSAWCCCSCCPCYEVCIRPKEKKEKERMHITIKTSQPPLPERKYTFPQSRQQIRVTSQLKTHSPVADESGYSTRSTGSKSPQRDIVVASESATLSLCSMAKLAAQYPILEFNVYYDTFRKSFVVHIHRGLHFPGRGFRVVNSFIKAFLMPSRKQVLKTRIIPNSRAPTYDQILEFSGLLLEELKEEMLVLQVYYHEMTLKTYKYISSCCIELKDINLKEGNQLVKRIDEGHELLENYLRGHLQSANEEINEMVKCAVNTRPELYFALYYNVHDHLLNVHVKKIERLPTSLPEGASNSFIQVYLLPDPTKMRPKQVFTTPIVKQSHEPVFDCMSTFRGMSLRDLSKEELVFRIYINNETQFIGGVYYPLPIFDSFGDNITAEILKFPEAEGLKEDLVGDLLLTLCYQLDQKSIVIKIMEVKLAQALSREDLNCYVKVNLMQEDERISKWKTMAKKLNVNSAYKEACKLDLTVIGEDEIEIHVLLMNAERFRHTELGLVKFGKDVPDYKTGESHWKESLDSPGKTIAAWHPIFRPPPTQLAPGLRRGSRSRSPTPTRLRAWSQSRSPTPTQPGRGLRAASRSRSPTPTQLGQGPTAESQSRSSTPTQLGLGLRAESHSRTSTPTQLGLGLAPGLVRVGSRSRSLTPTQLAPVKSFRSRSHSSQFTARSPRI